MEERISNILLNVFTWDFCKRYIEQSLCNPQIFAILTKNDSESEKDMTPPCCIR